MRGFLADRRGNYALMTVVAMVPLMGGLALAVDFAEMNRQKQAVDNALDAAGIATARQVVTGAPTSELHAYAKTFFEANLGSVNPADTQLSVVLPANQVGGGTLKLSAQLNYKPLFFPVFAELVGAAARRRQRRRQLRDEDGNPPEEHAGSGAGARQFGLDGQLHRSGQKRIDLLKAAAKQLVKTLADQAALIKQVDKPVQFSLVPFAASVNVGPDNAGASWMDVDGLSPVHQENFDWSTLNAPDKNAEKIGGIWYKKGTGWGDGRGTDADPLFALPRHEGRDQPRARAPAANASSATNTASNQHLQAQPQGIRLRRHLRAVRQLARLRRGPALSLQHHRRAGSGGPNNTGIGFGDPATMFVPMFAPDEPGNHWYLTQDPDEAQPDTYSAANSWWNDDPTSTTGRARQQQHGQVLHAAPDQCAGARKGAGPNYSCTTEPITPLTDVTVPDGLAAINAAIDRMARTAIPMCPRAWPGAGAPYRAASRSPRAAGNGEGQRQGRHRAHRRRQHLSPCRATIRPATSRPTRPMATCSRATTAPASAAC